MKSFGLGLCGVLGFIVVGALALSNASQEPKPQSRIELTSPDGKRKIVIEATNGIAGMWITTEGAKSSAPMVSIYAYRDEAAIGVVGAFNPDQKYIAYDACISANKEGGQAQFSTNDRRPMTFRVPADGLLKPNK